MIVYRFRKISEFIGPRDTPCIEDERLFTCRRDALEYRKKGYGEEIKELGNDPNSDLIINRFYPIEPIIVSESIPTNEDYPLELPARQKRVDAILRKLDKTPSVKSDFIWLLGIAQRSQDDARYYRSLIKDIPDVRPA